MIHIDKLFFFYKECSHKNGFIRQISIFLWSSIVMGCWISAINDAMVPFSGILNVYAQITLKQFSFSLYCNAIINANWICHLA